MNKFKYSNSNKRYHTYDYYLKHKYNCKVAKVSLDAGFTCPNRDGKVSTGGCIFCSEQGSGDCAGNRNDSLNIQFNKIKDIMLKKWPDAKLIAYFQAYTNTYAPIEVLKEIYEPFVNRKDILGICIATRPDCLNNEIVEYLSSINKRIDLTIELGLQTIHEKTAKLINRGYEFPTFINAVNLLRKNNIDVVVHLINGLPFENKEMMIESVKTISKLDIQGIKLHSLNVLKNTKLANMYLNNEFSMMNEDEYTSLVVEELRYIKPSIYIERVSGDANLDCLIAPIWSRKKTQVANDIDKKMAESNIYQGDLCNDVKESDAVKFSHELINKNKYYNVAIDATLGNGHDSFYLAKLFNKVISFDIQELALRRSEILLNSFNNVSLKLDSYINIDNYTSFADLILYNLGFLPGSNKKIKTNAIDTINSLKKAIKILNKDGHIIIVSYTRQDDNEEYSLLKEYLHNNKDIEVIEYDNFEYERIFYIKKISNN